MDDGPPGWVIPVYERMLAGVRPGTAVLDVGSGPGAFADVAAGRGMVVSSADVDEHDLPWPDGSFGLVTLVQVLESVPNPVVVLRAAGRLCEPGGRVRASVRGRPDECGTAVVDEILRPFLSNSPAQARPPRTTRSRPSGRASSLLAARPGAPQALTEPDRLRTVTEQAGLRVTGLAELECTFAYPDAEEFVGSVLESGPGRRAVLRSSGTRPVRRALLAGLERFRDGGGYRLRDTFRVVDATPGH